MLQFSADPKVAEYEFVAIIYYLTAFGYVDGDFDSSEKSYIRSYIGRLVQHRADEAMPEESDAKRELVSQWTLHFHGVLDAIDGEIQENLHEPVADGEDVQSFVIARLKLRCFELFKRLPEVMHAPLLGTVDELMMADGTAHPSEVQFRAELTALLHAPDLEFEDADIEEIEKGSVIIGDSLVIPPARLNHPFFASSEWDYSRDRETFAAQSVADLDIVRKATIKLDEARRAGEGTLKLGASFADFTEGKPFMDGHVIVHPPDGKDHDLLVLGDLHGCYSCLKAALLQADFFQKVQAYHDDPVSNPNMLLVLLGDYIDRGRFSYSGILRTVLQLYLAVPDHVIPLRGNHEYYVELNGRTYGAVKPAEAITSLQNIATNEVFSTYRVLFDALPNMFVFDKLFFVHAGIPRDDTLAAKWKGLSSLNDPEIRFQMLWSDPSLTDSIPLELQKQSARFPFGRKQFRHFMQKTGCTTMIRGHERIVDGFKEIYSEPDARLLNLFSAGGSTNADLPRDSNYREVKPKALTIRHRAGVSEICPFEIQYERYNSAETNAFFKAHVDV